MKRVLPIIFTFLYLLAMLRPVMPVFEYIINKDYIAEFYCVNKDKPMLNCDGKCYLAKMIQAQQEDKKQNLPGIDLREYPIGFVNITECNLRNPKEFINKSFFYQELYSYQIHPSIYHPPDC
ncbi:hypothetical protein [Abyssalbus ytuae]|uniref:Uncharacterized protein n=1 Tax=Abyssalbus ytuae TaxID=2926907 RepID=A0A9E6ZTD8_9FLAO|nr:hypothetical protein [Abyssalbus ytuae]UOB17473.1 hypothetical protein MQE35_17270 [Abyssalbus ytuae]